MPPGPADPAFATPPGVPPDVYIDIPVAWGEMDALGHVNNVVFFRYLESARIAFIRAHLAPSARTAEAAASRPAPAPPGGFLAGDASAPHAVGFILQHVECRFRRPIVYPDTLRVTARLASDRAIEPDRFTLEHEIISHSQGEVAAIGRGTIVTYDYAANAKTPIPPAMRAALEALTQR